MEHSEILKLIPEMIQTIEALEQEVEALKNEQPTESEVVELKKVLADAEKIITIISTERNTLSQALRVVSSQGRIDPVQETLEKEMVEEMNNVHI
jgi:hypothetical protein